MIRKVLDWLEDRTGVLGVIKPVLSHVIPPQGRVSGWFYVFGSATLAAFLLQVFTGTLLSLSYIPSSSQAYQTLQFITHQAFFGRVLRGMHFYGASAMILLVGLHMIRTFLTAAYKYPREVSWLSGVALLVLTLGMGFTGQLLRWDQNAVWSVVVGTEQAARVPVIGKSLAHFILGGDVLGGATLSRFFATHVFFFPGLIYLVLGLHLFLVVRNGISKFPSRGAGDDSVDPVTYRQRYRELLQKEGVPFWPNAAWRDVLFGALIVLAIVGLSVAFGPPDLDPPPDPTNIVAQPRPDWYLLWYFAVLALLPHGTEDFVIVLAPLIGGLVLVLPVFWNRGERSPARRPWAVIIIGAIVTMIGSFTLAGYRANWSPDFNPKPLPENIVASSDHAVVAGAQLMFNKACLNCHRISGQGGKRGPDLTYVGQRLTHNDIVIRIVNGGPNMPAYGPKLTWEELSNIAAFLETRKRSNAVQPSMDNHP